MRKIIHFLLFVAVFAQTSQTSAQLSVKGNSLVYNKGSLVFVQGNIELDANSKFYLRQEGQLLQGGTTLNGSNIGEGVLSVFQEGTADHYEYNYWCSPIGHASTGTGNENFDISMLGRPVDNINTTQAYATGSYNGTSNPLHIAKYWIWTFRNGLNYSNWFHISDMSYSNTDALKAGEGFTMKGTSGADSTNPGEVATNNPFVAATTIPPFPGVPSGQRYDFRGKPNDGNIPISLKVGSLTLTGNPYPSAMDLSAFLTAELNCTGIAYFWEQDKNVNSHNLADYRGGYGIYSPVSRLGLGVYVPAKFYAYDLGGNLLPLTETTPNNQYARFISPIGQGFMLEGANGAVGANVMATMRNSYRVYQKENAVNSVFERSANPNQVLTSGFLDQIPSVSGFDYTTVSTVGVPQIKFNTRLGDQAVKPVVLAFDAEATDGVDHAKDAKNPPDSSPMDMYFVMDNKEYVLSVIQFDPNKRIPVGFRSTTNTTAVMRVANMINFTAADHVYLYDKVTEQYHDILDAEYQFPLVQGTVNDRYEITFTNQALGVDTNAVSNFVVVQNNVNQQLSISNPNKLDVKSVVLYDIGGKSIFSKQNLGVEVIYNFSTGSLSEGVYIVKMQTTDNQTLSQKIIVRRKN